MRAGLFLVACACAMGRALAAEEAPDSRGPLVVPGREVRVDHDGVQTNNLTGGRIVPHLAHWPARWIGVRESDPAAQAICLRKEFTLDGDPVIAVAYLTGDPYTLYVNGRLAARGPADNGRDFQGVASGRRFVDCYDLTDLLHKGVNILAVEVTGHGFQGEIQIGLKGGPKPSLFTDESWKGVPCPYLRKPVQTPEQVKQTGKISVVFDAAAEPLGWRSPHFDDRAWPACVVVNPPADQLVPSELPPLMEVFYPYFEVKPLSGQIEIPDKPLTPGHPVVLNGDGEFLVHFDRIMSGRCGIAVVGCAGADLFLQSNETEAKGGRLYQIKLRDGLQYFESRDFYALGTIRVTLRNATQPVKIREVTADYLSQPIQYNGSFTCSDEALNQLWKSGRWSTQINLITHHLDSPQHQEPISDYGDYLVEDLVVYNTMGGGNPWLIRQDLRKFAWVMENAKYHTFHTSYLFYWIDALLNYADYTGDVYWEKNVPPGPQGDEAMVRELAPQVFGILDQFATYIGKNGLISEAPNYMFMDWVKVHDDKDPKLSFPCHHPPAVIGQGYMTALYYHALEQGIRVAQVVGDNARTAKYTKQREQIRTAYRAELWNETRGLYRDGKPFTTTVPPGKWLPADVAMESFSVQNNCLALLYDLVPPEQQRPVAEAMLKNPNWDVTPWFMHFVFNSLDHVGLFDREGVRLMKDYVIEPGTQTVREMGPNRGDFSHGWIASPTYQMTSKILGVKPLGLGFEHIEIRPTFCGLSYARGVVPSPHGPISVDWKRTADSYTIQFTVPNGADAKVILPVGEAISPKLKSGDKVLWDGSVATATFSGLKSIARDGGDLKVDATPGTYSLEVTLKP